MPAGADASSASDEGVSVSTNSTPEWVGAGSDDSGSDVAPGSGSSGAGGRFLGPAQPTRSALEIRTSRIMCRESIRSSCHKQRRDRLTLYCEHHPPAVPAQVPVLGLQSTSHSCGAVQGSPSFLSETHVVVSVLQYEPPSHGATAQLSPRAAAVTQTPELDRETIVKWDETCQATR